jgi:hypothetical protein
MSTRGTIDPLARGLAMGSASALRDGEKNYSPPRESTNGEAAGTVSQRWPSGGRDGMDVGSFAHAVCSVWKPAAMSYWRHTAHASDPTRTRARGARTECEAALEDRPVQRVLGGSDLGAVRDTRAQDLVRGGVAEVRARARLARVRAERAARLVAREVEARGHSEHRRRECARAKFGYAFHPLPHRNTRHTFLPYVPHMRPGEADRSTV